MKEFIKKFLGFSLGPIIGAIIGFITVPITSHLVTADQFGLSNMFTLATNIISLIALVGIDQAFAREYNEVKDRKKLLFNSLFIPFIATIIIAIILLIFQKQFAQILFDNGEMIKPVILLAIFTPLFIIEKFMLLSLRMQEKALRYSLWNIVSKAFNLVLTVVFLVLYKRNFESIIYASIFSQGIVSFILLFVCRKSFGISKKYIDKKLIKTLTKFGLPLVPANVIGWGLNSMDSIFLRAMTTYTELGYYSVAIKVSNVLTLLQTSFTTFWTPLAFKWKAQNVPKERFTIVNDAVACIMSIVLIGILMFKNIIPVFFGKGYNEIIYIIPFLLFYPIFYTMSETTTLGIYFTKKTFYNIIISIVSLVSNLILNILLIPKIGAIGAAMATGISYLVFFWARTLISRNLWYKFKLNKFIVITIILIIAALVNSLMHNIAFVSLINMICLICVLITYKDIIIKLIKYLKIKKSNVIINKKI